MDEVIAFESHLVESGKYTYDNFGNPESTRDLSEWESQWMLNEQILCLCDALYFLSRYAFVKNEEGQVERFRIRVPQRILFDIISDLESRDASIEIILLKARQLGVSTIIQLLIAHRIIFGRGVSAIAGSADQTKTGLMVNMLFLCYDMMPVWLRPKWTRRVESDRGMLVFGQNATGVSFQHGSTAGGIARGTTPTVYHLSECASFPDPAKQIEAALFKAVHASPSVFGVLESTGEGDKGWWPDTWRHSKSNWKDNRARLCPLFLPWFCGIDMYPKPTWLRMRPVPRDWTPNADTRKHTAKSELFVRSNALLSKHLIAHQQATGTFHAPHWRMPLEQQWFWEVEHDQAKSKGMEGVFLQEMAGDDEEALQRSTESVFGHDVIEVLEDSRERDYDIYGLSGQSIESFHEPPPEYIDYARERIPIKYASQRGETYKWELIPARFSPPLRENNAEDAIGKFIVFHHPSPGVNYSIGVDTSEGKGQDSTVISVWSVGTRGAPDVQCAEFASSYVNHTEAFAFVLPIAAYYKKYMGDNTKWREPYVSIEQVQSVGDVCQLQMRKMGYSNFHRMIRYDNRHVSKARASKMGWYTFGWSRPILTGNFVHAVRNNWARINSPWLIGEMAHFEAHVTRTGKEKMEHEDGECDDRIFAAAMAIFCPHDLDVLADRSHRRFVEHGDALPPVDIGEYTGDRIAAADMRQTRPLTLQDVIYSDHRLEKFSR